MTILCFKELNSYWKRLRGLLGTKLGDRSACPVVLEPCQSIHTIGMHYPIDVAFVAKDGRVIRSACNVAPGNKLSSRQARCVLERPCTKAVPWPKPGEYVSTIKQEGAYRYVRF